MKTLVIIIIMTSATLISVGQEKVELLPFGNMDSWISRNVKESFVIGGKMQTLYDIGDRRDQVEENTPYVNKVSPWANSSVYAKVNGVTKGSATVFPEKRGDGFAARLETKVERVKVMGIININVLASGTIFLGRVLEPITDTKNALMKIMTGIPFTGKPAYLQFDYKTITGGAARKINGLSSEGTATGTISRSTAYIFLQNRWEDKDGNIFAKRIGTGMEVFTQSVSEWKNKYRIPVHYGDITGETFFTNRMDLKSGTETYYTQNSKGKVVPVREIGWGTHEDPVTHLFVQFSSSDGGPFVGNPSNRLWVDNVSLVYR